MLPFLKNDKKMSGAILEIRRTPDQDSSEPKEAEDGNAALKACAEDILRAVKSGDASHLALALQAAYDICESAEPQQEDSEEGSIEPHSYDSQK